MKKSAILMFTGLFAMNLAQGQELFKVLANKGSNEVKSGSVWQAIKTGDKLKKDDELKVSENSYVALVHNTGKPIELREAKTYKIADLALKMGAGTSVLNKYTDFILSSNSAEAKKNRMSATGSVKRGGHDIEVFLPDNSLAETFNSKVIFSWQSKSQGPYIVTLRNMFSDELMKTETSETSIEIDRSIPKLVNEDAILVEVRFKSEPYNPNKDYGAKLIRKTSATRKDAIQLSLSNASSDVKEETAINKFIMAGFYEENKLLVDAITAYQQAIKLAPDVPAYKEAYEEFLYRNGLKEFKK
jgi:hypothetical protein